MSTGSIIKNTHSDCRLILQEVSRRHEETTTSVATFGHPTPPQLQVLPLSNQCLLVVAYTTRVVCAQVLVQTGPAKQGPQLLCEFPVHIQQQEQQASSELVVESTSADEQEYEQSVDSISCLTIVPLEPALQQQVDQRLLQLKERQHDTDNSPNNDPMIIHDDTHISCAIVFGTRHCDLYTMELVVNLDDGTLSASHSDPSINDPPSFSPLQVLPRDDRSMAERIERAQRRRQKQSQYSHTLASFQPTRGVASLRYYGTTNEEAPFVWVTYGDGTLIRLASIGCFPSIWRRAVELQVSLDVVLERPSLVRCQVQLPRDHEMEDEVDQHDIPLIVPLPQSFPSPMALIPTEPWKLSHTIADDEEEEDAENARMEEASTISEDSSSDNPVYEALVFGCNHYNLPTVTFWTSEQQYGSVGLDKKQSNHGGEATDNLVVGATKAIVGGVFGALRWGFGGSNDDADNQETIREENTSRDDESMDDGQGEQLLRADSLEIELQASPFPTLWHAPIQLVPGQELQDSPRHIHSCSIDPSGKLAATCDNLGRVLLIDLPNRQIIRMWKGHRDASCSWIQSTDNGDESSHKTHLVIHSRIRRVLEVWQIRHGPRIRLVHLDRGAAIVPALTSALSPRASSFLVHSALPGSSLNQMEEITATASRSMEQDRKASSSVSSPPQSVPSTPSAREAALKLQHLRQILSSSSQQLTEQDVYDSLQQISNLVDLSTSLDLLAVSPILEGYLRVDGTSFHHKAVAHCKETLAACVKDGGTASRSNPNAVQLSRKIQYHTQIMKAFDQIHRFENSPNYAGAVQTMKNPPNWILEAIGWTTLYKEMNGGEALDVDTTIIESPMTFASFAAACRSSKVLDKKGSQIMIHFSDSTRTRRDVIIHIFRPLLSDLFSYKVVCSVFEALSIAHDFGYLMQCFGEWVMTLSVEELCQKGMLSEQSTFIRFLEDMASKQIEQGKLNEDDVLLGELHTFCSKATDLVRAFILAVLCRNATETISRRMEELTYGTINSDKAINDWETLLRRIRVCLLVNLRLKNVRFDAPISVAHVDEVGLFSVYQWLAHDELSVSHAHEEIVALEMACRISSLSFDPSLSEGDGPIRFKQLQSVCLAASIEEEERVEYLLEMDDTEDKCDSILLFFRSHNESSILAAHRARLLSLKWCESPSGTKTLERAMTALQSLAGNTTMTPVAAAVALDIWNTSLCPIYRARLFGFEDSPQIKEEIFSELFHDKNWMYCLGQIALRTLEFLNDAQKAGEDNGSWESIGVKDDGGPTWPPVRTDSVLKRLVDRNRPLDESALDTHMSLVSALLISDDVDGLALCVPSIFECFLPHSLYSPFSPTEEGEHSRSSYLEECVLTKARMYDGPVMQTFDLGEIEILCRVWGYDSFEARTLFLLSMYEVGNDRFIDELLTNFAWQMHAQRFVEGGVDIACRRIHAYISGREMQSHEMRDTMGMLDADLCEWIKNRARNSKPRSPVVRSHVSIGQTHLFTLRLLSLSASSNVDTALRVKIHSMVVLTGTLVKVLEIKGIGTRHEHTE